MRATLTFLCAAVAIGCSGEPRLAAPTTDATKLGDSPITVEISGDKPRDQTVRMAVLVSKQVASRCRLSAGDAVLVIAIGADGWPFEVSMTAAVPGSDENPAHKTASCAKTVILEHRFPVSRTTALVSIARRF